MGANCSSLAHQVDHQGHQGLYEYDAGQAVLRVQLGTDKVHDVRNYIKERPKALGSFEAEEKSL